MRHFISILFAGLMISAQVWAVSAKDVCGRFDGDLNIGGSPFPGKSIYLLPGMVKNTVTFVLPDFTYNAGKLGNIVLPNIPMDESGMLTLENATLYLDSISERATITVVNGLEDGGIVYNSVVSASEAQVLLSIAASSLPEPILVLFVGQAVRNRNYTLPNGGLEGSWTNNEPEGWHSFFSATGLMVDFIKNNYQFIPSTQVRPGSAGRQSALLSSTMALGVKANGNCTNGQINAGSSTADDPAGNYNFSDPANHGFNTPFHGNPDSLVFWAKYQPADRDASNPVNKARAHAVITTDARYQDPEVGDAYAAVKIADAELNYAATASMGWQRLAVPFNYTSVDPATAAYILVTFTTNMTPGGGSSYSTGGSFNKVNVLDSIYLDDIRIVYNRTLTSFGMDADKLTFTDKVATVATDYCDDCAKFTAVSNGQSAQTFMAFDALHRCIFVYVIAADYAQTKECTLYRVDFADSDTDGLEPLEPAQAIEQVPYSGTSSDSRKVLKDGRIRIIRGGNVYTITGQQLR